MSVTITRQGESTVIVTFRVDAKLHYGLQLLARKQRRSLNSVMEWALTQLTEDPTHGLIEPSPDGKAPRRNILEEVWDQDEADRVINLAQKFPSLLSHEEARVWKAIKENRSLWINARTPDLKKIRGQWETLKDQDKPQRRQTKVTK
jgi:hypothetical protein